MAKPKTVTLAHGGGGTASEELIADVFLPHLANPLLDGLSDGAVFDPPKEGRLAFSTDTFVIDPVFFPGGNIGSLAVHGTVNDLAVSGATPRYLSAGFVLEEGLPLADLKTIAHSMGQAAEACGVHIVTGDTKVVPRGSADGLYINTSGIGFVPAGVDIKPANVQAGDKVILSGSIGDHGMAIMTLRKGLEFESELLSDSQPLNGLTSKILDIHPDIPMMRDPTRGGLAATLHEVAQGCGRGIRINEGDIPIKESVRSVCEILGLDPLHVANEGKLVAFARPDKADAVLQAMQNHPAGADAAVIGEVGAAEAGMVEMTTTFIGSRIIEPLVGDQLPRIC